jgi:hypothetical protein
MHIVTCYGRLEGAGVDYLTCSAKDLAPSRELYRIADRWWSQHPEEGEVNADAFFRSYRGRQTSSLFVGTRSDGTLLRASGRAAGDLGIHPAKFAANVSRLDIQATVRSTERTGDLAGDAYRSPRARILRGGRAHHLTHIETNKGGSTLYVGKRSSDKYARLYDKGIESECAAPRTLWRYEVELKRDVAYQTAQALLSAKSVPYAASSMVHAHFLRRGITPNYRPADCQEIPSVGLHRSDLERRLRWLVQSVRPVMEKTRGHVSDVTLARLVGLPIYDQDCSYAVLEQEQWMRNILDMLVESHT